MRDLILTVIIANQFKVQRADMNIHIQCGLNVTIANFSTLKNFSIWKTP